jgi:hypothetical protein
MSAITQTRLEIGGRTSRSYQFPYTDGPKIERDIAEREFYRATNWLRRCPVTTTEEYVQVCRDREDALLRYFAARRAQDADVNNRKTPK